MTTEYAVSGGVNPSALSFDGVDDYVRNNVFTMGANPTALTVSGWFKRTGSITGKGAWAIGAGGQTARTISGWNNVGEKIGIDLWGSNTFYVADEYPLNEWINIAWVKDGIAFSTATVKIYVNGIEKSLLVHRNSGATPDLTDGITVGGIIPSGTTYFAPMVVDDFRIYNVVLTQAEIQAYMNRELIGNESSLIGYWKFNEGSGTTATDSTANGNNGTISGATYTTDAPTLNLVINVKENWTDIEKINFGDFNRIEQNTITTRDYLNLIEYAIPSITTKTDRTLTWIDFLSSINRLEQNLETIRTNFITPSGYPGTETWLVGIGFDYTDANRIEEDIRLLFVMAGLVYESFVQCGTIRAGYSRGDLSVV